MLRVILRFIFVYSQLQWRQTCLIPGLHHWKPSGLVCFTPISLDILIQDGLVLVHLLLFHSLSIQVQIFDFLGHLYKHSRHGVLKHCAQIPHLVATQCSLLNYKQPTLSCSSVFCTPIVLCFWVFALTSHVQYMILLQLSKCFLTVCKFHILDKKKENTKKPGDYILLHENCR